MTTKEVTVQGSALLDAVVESMPHYPLDEAFVASLPNELTPDWEDWKSSIV